MLSTALIVTAALAGLAGSWSPCGMSMMETLQRRPAATAAFALGSIFGGAVTFGGLALLGTTLAGPLAALAVAALAAGALGDAAGRRIVPQVRRQVPESWRRFLPLPLAAVLYGVLLGLGFTTFLLSYATWALAAACLAVGTPATGLAVGVAFGVGRALPIVVLADAALLAERPQVLRGLRAAAATALAMAAGVLVVTPPDVRAAIVAAHNAYDPSAAGSLFAYQPAAGTGILIRNGATVSLPGTHPAVNETEVAWIQDDAIVVADAATLAPVLSVPAHGADAVALSPTHVAWRAGFQLLGVDRLAPTTPIEIATARGMESIGRPALSDSTVVFDHQSRKLSRIRSLDLATGERDLLRRAVEAQVLAPTLTDRGLLYVRASDQRQKLVLDRRVIFSTTPTARRDRGHEKGHGPHREGYRRGRRPKPSPRPPAGVAVTLWTTAYAGGTAYVTRVRHLRGGRTRSRILRVSVPRSARASAAVRP